ncbi:MAG: signal recognition particle protein [Phycisphaerae bacterium]|nr:signal recognition particle protein [Phycisphaerae bacterium]
MFEGLSRRLHDALRNLSGRGRISESNIREAMEEVRTALLEADVHHEVVESFCREVAEDAVGQEVTRSLKPGEEMIGIVHRRLVELMGEPAPLRLVEPGPTVILMCGLQGSGKTTTCGKLAARLKSQGKSVLLVAADLQRPAAVEQLRIVAAQVAADAPGSGKVAFHGEPERCAEHGRAVGVAVGVATRGLERARRERFDVLIIDTAGRLHVDEDLMKELRAIDRAVEAQEILLVVDAMSGQDALTSAKAFHAAMQVDGVILTKFDSDSRGGAALSVRRVTGAPIRFVGVGEKFASLEEFHPERVAGRILGMGDVVSLVEKARQEVSDEEAAELMEKMSRGQLGLDDFLRQLKVIRRMGPIKQLLGMLPGVGSMLKELPLEDGQLDRIQGIVHSMTPAERRRPEVLDRSRIARIARGSASQNAEVSRLVKQFELMRKMGSQLAGAGAAGRLAAMRGMQSGGLPTRGSTYTASPKSRFKQRPKR